MKYIFISISILLLVACSTSKPLATVQNANIPTAYNNNKPLLKKPKNIILMIGDGMGLTQVSAGMFMNGNRLHLERCTHTGLHKSYSANDLITDSAAGATAFSAGVKTYNYAIGVGTDTLPRKTILEMAEENGLATGLIATCEVTHATPAAFFAHQKDRKMNEAIANDFLASNVDLVIAAGKKYFNKRADKRDLTKELQTKGYYVSDFTKENLELMVPPEQNMIFFTADSFPPKVSEGRDYLPLASSIAPLFLKGRSAKGFFMMIEGSQIDWGGHSNDADHIITEMIDFDNAIGAILDWAEKDGETLVIVTADHETGGFAINKGSKMGSLNTAFTTKEHTGCLIPVFAYGPGAEQFSGIYENTAIFDKMKRLFGF